MVGQKSKEPSTVNAQDNSTFLRHTAENIFSDYIVLISYNVNTDKCHFLINSTGSKVTDGRFENEGSLTELFLSRVHPSDRKKMPAFIRKDAIALKSETAFTKTTESIRFRYKTAGSSTYTWYECVIIYDAVDSEFSGNVTVGMKNIQRQIEADKDREFSAMLGSMIADSYSAVYEYDADTESLIKLVTTGGKIRRGLRKSDVYHLDDDTLIQYSVEHIEESNRADFINHMIKFRTGELSNETDTVECRYRAASTDSFRFYSYTIKQYILSDVRYSFLFVADVHHIRTAMTESQLKLQKAVFEAKNTVNKQSKQIIENYNNAIDVLSSVVEYRSLESGEHIHRIRYFTETLLMSAIKVFPEENLTDEKILSITNASSLHDVGKIGIPDSILLKPGKLTTDEFEVIKQHTTIGAEIAGRIKYNAGIELAGNESEYSCQICLCHHERTDGRGYPRGLKEEEIPFCAQIVAVADVYDALTHERVYKPAYSHDEAYRMIMNGECGAFSRRILECLSLCKSYFAEI